MEKEEAWMEEEEALKEEEEASKEAEELWRKDRRFLRYCGCCGCCGCPMTELKKFHYSRFSLVLFVTEK